MARHKQDAKGEAGSAQAKQSTLRRVIGDLGSDRKRMLVLVAIIGLAKIGLAFAPRVAGGITDYVSQGGTDHAWFLGQCALLAVLFFVGNAMDIFVAKNMVRISQSLVMRLRNLTIEKLGRMKISYLDGHPLGDIQSRMSNDLITLASGFESTAPALVGQAVLLVGLFLAMLVTNFRLALIYLVVFVVGFMVMGRITKATSKLFKRQNAIVGTMNGLVSDTYAHHTLVKAYGCDAQKLAAFDEQNRLFRRNYVRSRFFSGITFPLSILQNNVAYVLLCVIGGSLMLTHALTVGEFLAFILFGNMVSMPLMTISSSLTNVQNALSAASRVYDFLDEEEVAPDAPSAVMEPDSLRGEVAFEHVRFGYVPGKTLMTDVSFVAPPGSFSAIVGPSGAGKTTLINLLMRFYEIDGGRILLDGTDTKALAREDLRRGFGMVLQDTWVFDGTIADNIAYGKRDATREEIIEAARKAQCDDFISRLSEGYDTSISEERSGLSAGERQLIAIARTILCDPAILILDEATSQVDTRTEYRIVKAMEELTRGRTTFMIAHRLFTIRNADQIMYMENGNILEVGSHEELLARGGRYAALCRAQFEGMQA